MLLRYFGGRMRSTCATRALLTAAILLPATAATVSTASAQSATTLPPVTVEKPKPKPKTAAKPKVKRTAPATAEPAASQPMDDEDGASASASASEPKGLARPATTTTIKGSEVTAKAAATSDTSQLLNGVPGVSSNSAGGVSSLPIIQGMEDDRVKILVNGAVASSACANHMNPPLSYVSPGQVKKIDVYAGVTPVSVGGDSTGGTIVVETVGPEFAMPGQGVVTHGSLSSYVRSNGNQIGGSATASAATSNVAASYNGAYARADNYKDGRGDEVKSSEYEAQNHALQLAARKNGDLYLIEAGIQAIPFQGFPNQYMDMTKNDAWYINGRYDGQFSWGKLQARAYYREVTHEMDFMDDKVAKKIATNMSTTMPMNVDGVDAGYSVKAEILLTPQDMLRVGSELHHQGLNEWWPPVSAAFPGMWPYTFINVNHGTRDTLGTFAEWERKWTSQWTTLVGIRNDIVWMDTGIVQGYNRDNMNYARDADAFNAQDHSKTDINFDMTALARYEPNATSLIEGGYSRKTRSPSIYERYTWSYGGMASRMIGWYGDLNGYVGDIDLDPEIAHKLSLTVGWHDRAQKVWNLRITPYYSYVQDFITAEQVAQQPPANTMVSGAAKQLQFVNHDAELYGVDISGKVNLGETAFGRFALTGVVGFVHGDDLESDTALYHMMPWNARLALVQQIGRWTNTLELQLMNDKDRVDSARLEPTTSGYALVNLRSSYEFNQNIRVDFGVENVFDKDYELPFGGRDFMDRTPVAGMGRSFYAGMTMKF